MRRAKKKGLPDRIPGRSAADYILTVGETAMDIAVSVVLLILVGRSYGPGGLGTYTFLLSVFVIVSFLAEFGVDKWVEKELAGRRGDPSAVLAGAKAAVLVSGVLGTLATLLLGRWLAGSETVARGTWQGFVFIAAAVPLALYSGYLGAALHGRGQHSTAARAGLVKRAAQVVLVFFLSAARLRPDLLMSVFVLGEITFIALAAGRVGAPSVVASLGKLGELRDVFRRSIRYYFTQEGLRVLFFVDFFALGFFVSAAREGAYAEASVLARLFLLVPLGAAPLFRVRIYRISGTEDPEAVYPATGRTAARFFTAHAATALVFLLYFPHILKVIFHIQGDVPVFFNVFAALLPGLLLFIPTLVTEPLFIHGAKEEDLNRISLMVFVLNAFLNFYLIPFSGILGAAAATTVSLLVYFILFSRNLERGTVLKTNIYLLAGAVTYSAYHVLAALKLPAIVKIPLTAVTLPVLFGVVGLYEQEEEKGGRGEEGRIVPFPGAGERESGGEGE